MFFTQWQRENVEVLGQFSYAIGVLWVHTKYPRKPVRLTETAAGLKQALFTFKQPTTQTKT